MYVSEAVKTTSFVRVKAVSPCISAGISLPWLVSFYSCKNVCAAPHIESDKGRPRSVWRSHSGIMVLIQLKMEFLPAYGRWDLMVNHSNWHSNKSYVGQKKHIRWFRSCSLQLSCFISCHDYAFVISGFFYFCPHMPEWILLPRNTP